MTVGLVLLSVGLILLVISLALDIKIKWRDLMLIARKLEAKARFRVVILMLGVLSTLAGVSVLVWTVVAASTTDGGPFVKSTTTAYAGPSTAGYHVTGTITVNTRVRVICTAYGQPNTFDGHVVSLWDYTDRGWLNDHYVSTGTTEPTATGCTGGTSKPRAGTTRTTMASGPYAVITDEGNGLPVRSGPNPSAEVIHELPSGQFVRLQCTLAQGPLVPAPRALGSAHSNNVWDRITTPPGWVPDSFVATYSLTPVAPPC